MASSFWGIGSFANGDQAGGWRSSRPYPKRRPRHSHEDCRRSSLVTMILPRSIRGRLNRQLRGSAAFYKYTNFTATTLRHVDHVVFWKTALWLARKYRNRIKPLMRSWYRAPVAGQAKTRFVHGVVNEARVGSIAPIGIQSKEAVPMEKPGSKSLHLQGGAQEDHHLAISLMSQRPRARLERRAVCAERCP
ncbi:group II intron maturase-specific domain-containing protein [Bradyrhizobium sp. CCGB01]|uniref:group II intron maturase-specific domain-containing protein n=1 Tax=Bradyrhizobium sp. CCGB01 TaxID=2949634 RepID=UPI0035C6D256